jgi:putative FmdB family regulatory protein
MATYEYRCLECERSFTVRHPIGEHERKRPKCPKCGSRKVEQKLSSFFAKTARKS